MLLALSGLLLMSCEDNDNPLDDDESIAVADLPSAITDYVADNYPDDAIEEAELEDDCQEDYYEIELDSDEELYFAADGSFLGTDEPYENCDDMDDDDDDSGGGYGYGDDDDDDD